MKRQPGSLFYKPKARTDVIRRKRWNWPRMLGKIVKRACTALGALILFSIFMGIVAASLLPGKAKVSMPDDMILVMNVEDGIGEEAAQPRLTDPFAMGQLTVRGVVRALDHAARDKRVKGVLVSLDSGGLQLAHIQELRTAVKNFRLSGKTATLYTDSFADLGSGIGAYYLATAFDKIWMQPVGMVSINGVSLEMPFGRALLDKIGVEPSFFHREQYKSAMESFTNTEMSAPNKEMMVSIVQELSGDIFRDIAADRKIKPENLQSYVDRGLITGEEALQAGLIDRVDYADVLIKETRAAMGKKDSGKDAAIGDAKKSKSDKDEDVDLPLIDIVDYVQSLPPEERGAVRHSGVKSGEIALVTVSGEIVTGSEVNPGKAVGGVIASAINDAADDKRIKAILLRVDSPGGSPTASETIRRSILRAKEKGKKIIVSMGPYAASGGYWIVVDADRIFAMPSTLTGSIGVIMGKFDAEKLWDKVGVNWQNVEWGENASMWSLNRPFSESQTKVMNAAIDSMYDDFLTRVSNGRHIKKEQVRAIAKGRAYTGRQALKIGLVDEIGDLNNALDYAATQMGLKGRENLNIRVMPKPRTAIEELLSMMGSQVSLGYFVRDNQKLMSDIQPVLSTLGSLQEGSGIRLSDPMALRIQ